MIYFDNGATTFPKPESVAAAAHEALTRYGANPGRSGHELSLQTAMKVYETRAAAAALFGLDDPQEAVFTLNCTHAINLAVKGLLGKGHHVILSDLDHNALLRPIHTLAASGVITYDIAPTCEDPASTVASFRKLIRAETVLIACTHASNVFGIRLPIEQLGELCRRYGLYFLVDAAQTAGLLDINAAAMGIDFLCAAGHKGLYGPAGTGLLLTAVGERLDTIIEGGTGSFSMEYGQPLEMPDRMESGTVNTPGILGLGAGVAFVREQGTENLYRHEMELAAFLFEELRRIPRARVYTPHFGPGTHLPVLSFNLDGMHSEEVTERLSRLGYALRGGLHCAPLAHKKMGTLTTGAARITPGAFNTAEDAEGLAKAIRTVAQT